MSLVITLHYITKLIDETTENYFSLRFPAAVPLASFFAAAAASSRTHLAQPQTKPYSLSSRRRFLSESSTSMYALHSSSPAATSRVSRATTRPSLSSLASCLSSETLGSHEWLSMAWYGKRPVPSHGV